MMRKRIWVGSVAALSSVCLLSTSGVSGQKKLEPLNVPLTDVSINKVPYVTAKEAGLYEEGRSRRSPVHHRRGG